MLLGFDGVGGVLGFGLVGQVGGRVSLVNLLDLLLCPDHYKVAQVLVAPQKRSRFQFPMYIIGHFYNKSSHDHIIHQSLKVIICTIVPLIQLFIMYISDTITIDTQRIGEVA